MYPIFRKCCHCYNVNLVADKAKAETIAGWKINEVEMNRKLY